ncbi:MAG: hypothetical protein WD054_04075 [Gemmatimonadota bacterium]
MYFKPELERFGSLRDITQLGSGPDCDGGVWGINPGTPADGSSNRCDTSSRS